MVLHRLADPLSKWGILTQWWEDSSAPLFVGLPIHRLHNNAFSRALVHLWVHQDTLERKLYQEVVRPRSGHPDVFFHDTTSTWVEGVPGELSAFSGYAPDGRTDRPRVKWGMVVAEGGWPVTIQLFPGNTKDDPTVRPMRDRLTRVFGVTSGIYVGDRGMKSARETAGLAAHGFQWILAERNPNVEEVLLAAKGRPIAAVSEKNEAREVILDQGRYVVLLNAERRAEELATLARRRAEGELLGADRIGFEGRLGGEVRLERVSEEELGLRGRGGVVDVLPEIAGLDDHVLAARRQLAEEADEFLVQGSQLRLADAVAEGVHRGGHRTRLAKVQSDVDIAIQGRLQGRDRRRPVSFLRPNGQKVSCSPDGAQGPAVAPLPRHEGLRLPS